MATHYVYGTILTGEAVAANNRADNIGNTTTLQKVFLHDDLHSSVSAEAIRFALRYRFQLEQIPTNRTYSDDKLHYEDETRQTFIPKTKAFIDDDLMGFMDAKAAKKESEDDSDEDTEDSDAGESKAKTKSSKKAPGKAKPKGTTTKRTSPLSIGRAVSLRPYRGEMSFNAVSGVKEKGKLSLYNAEMHTTEYQYSFGLNLGDVIHKEHIGHLLDAIADPPPVAGNHSRFAYDFSPASIVLRCTSAHSSRIQNCFEHDEKTRGFHVQKLLDRVQSGDVPAAEVIVGGEIARSSFGAQLRSAGVATFDGVDAAVGEAKARIAKLEPEYAVVAAKGG